MREKNIRIIGESSREIQALKVGGVVFVMSSQEPACRKNGFSMQRGWFKEAQ